MIAARQGVASRMMERLRLRPCVERVNAQSPASPQPTAIHRALLAKMAVKTAPTAIKQYTELRGAIPAPALPLVRGLLILPVFSLQRFKRNQHGCDCACQHADDQRAKKDIEAVDLIAQLKPARPASRRERGCLNRITIGQQPNQQRDDDQAQEQHDAAPDARDKTRQHSGSHNEDGSRDGGDKAKEAE